jgi:hypothetical protein
VQQQRQNGKLDPAVSLIVSFGVYELLRQTSVIGDGATILDYAWRHHLTHDIHFLYLPLMGALRWLLDGTGISVFQIASHLSCTVASIGVAVTHCAFRAMRMTRRDAALATALTAACPGLVFYATTVELHALFFGVASLALLAAAHLAMRPSWSRGALLGLATGVAYCAHATGAMLPMPLLLLAWAIAGARDGSTGWPKVRPFVVPAAATALVHFASVWGIPFLLRSLSDRFIVAPEHAESWIANNAAGGWGNLSAAFVTTSNEWLIPAFPISIAWLRGWLVPGARWMSLGLTLSFVPYLGISFVLLAAHSERGAYLLPLYWLAAWIVVRAWPFRLVLLQVVLALAAAVTFVKSHDDPERVDGFVAGLREVAGDTPLVLMTGEVADIGACFVGFPDAFYLRLEQLAMMGEAQARVFLPTLDAFLDESFASGKRVFVTAQVEQVAQPNTFAGSGVLHDVILPHLRERFRVTPVHSGGFEGQELTRP